MYRSDFLFALALVLVCIPLVLACESASGTCWYVATDGSDDNPGTISEPFKTFRPAVAQASPGDTIYVRGGTYTDEHAMASGTIRVTRANSLSECDDGQTFADGWCRDTRYRFMNINDWSGWASNYDGYTVNQGTQERPIIVSAYPGERVVLDSRGVTQGINIEKSYWVIEHLELRGSNIHIWGGAYPNNPHDIIIRHNRLYDYGDDWMRIADFYVSGTLLD